MQSIVVAGYNSGVLKNKKPFLIPDQAFKTLENAYVFREEVRKREGLQLIGRLRRVLTSKTLSSQTTNNTTITISDLFSELGITGEANANIEPGTLTIQIDNPAIATFTDVGTANGSLHTTGTGVDAGSYVNYATGDVVLQFNPAPAAMLDIIVTVNYFPALPVMGIRTREVENINDENTTWFDTKYAYTHDGSNYSEYLPASAVTWDGDDSDFFWTTNYRGSDAQTRLFFATNFNPSSGSPMRYTDNSTWTTFNPAVDSTNLLLNARILIPYYGRLVALNVYEGPTADYVGAANYYNRARFSQIGSPIAADAWRSDEFGKGGFIDAPTNEEITGATFYKNTLIVTFERSTWRLQYLGEYGLPFIWERVSSDYGSESTFSNILFDRGVLAVGDKAIVVLNGTTAERIDLDIPDQVYSFKNSDNGVKRVHGVRDFRNELLLWCFPDFPTLEAGQYYPNKSLLYNYRNNTFAFFRNSVTVLGTYQYPSGVTWDRQDVFWDNYNITWDSGLQSNYPVSVSGNQQGFCHYFGYPDVETESDSTISALDQESLAIQAVTVTSVVTVNIPNHNLTSGECIYLTGLLYLDTTDSSIGSTTLNDKIYFVSFVDKDNVILSFYNPLINETVTNFPVTNVGTYIGGGVAALFPVMNIQTKDFNPIKAVGRNIQTSYIDFLFDTIGSSNVKVNVNMNTGNGILGNMLIGNTTVEQGNSMSGTIIGATLDDPCVITSKDHGLLDGYKILISSVVGMTELNGNVYTITFIDTDSFSIGVDSTLYTTYESGGYWEQNLQKYFTLSSQYAWHRFLATTYGQFFSIQLTYDEKLMSLFRTHQQNFALNAMQIYYRPGGKNIFGR